MREISAKFRRTSPGTLCRPPSLPGAGCRSDAVPRRSSCADSSLREPTESGPGASNECIDELAHACRDSAWRLPERWVVMKRLFAGGAILSMVAALVLAGGPASARPAAAVPPEFHAQSMSWISAQHGWMLGTAPCGSSTCTTVLGTPDAGGTWNTVGTINAAMTLERASGVTEIRFADDLHGWAFDPAAWVTNDGGLTWSKLRPPGNRPVIAMAGDAQGFYGVVSACGYGIPISNCEHPTTLWRITPGQSAWTQIQLTLPVAN